VLVGGVIAVLTDEDVGGAVDVEVGGHDCRNRRTAAPVKAGASAVNLDCEQFDLNSTQTANFNE
jgi:hypothetical protein